jgi:hypothetical protein
VDCADCEGGNPGSGEGAAETEGCKYLLVRDALILSRKLIGSQMAKKAVESSIDAIREMVKDGRVKA